jgi:hypothetical protein
MDRLAAHDADEVLPAVYDHALSGQRLRVETAERMKAQESVVVDVRDDETDLIHVRGDHHLLRRAAASESRDIAEVVDADIDRQLA